MATKAEVKELIGKLSSKGKTDFDEWAAKYGDDGFNLKSADGYDLSNAMTRLKKILKKDESSIIYNLIEEGYSDTEIIKILVESAEYVCDNCGGHVIHEPSPKYNPGSGNVDSTFRPYSCTSCGKSFEADEVEGDV